MSHNYEHDKNILRFLLNSDARYIGALGPKRRTENILREWRDAAENFSDEQLSRLYAPIGLDIGADTPESIALSIIAEIKSVLTNRNGGFLRQRIGSIYNR
jgi:xanthine/CO dehydrogenase XdhC/CoxF family maturation factor